LLESLVIVDACDQTRHDDAVVGGEELSHIHLCYFVDTPLTVQAWLLMTG
jgi:hypothetical protein